MLVLFLKCESVYHRFIALLQEKKIKEHLKVVIGHLIFETIAFEADMFSLLFVVGLL